MNRIAYVDGQYLPHNAACVYIEDRGYQLADGVYEVLAVRDGFLIDYDWQMGRLRRSLSELRIPLPISSVDLNIVFCVIVRCNRFKIGIVYVQTKKRRGEAGSLNF